MKKTQSWKGKFIKDKRQTSFEILIQTKKHMENIMATWVLHSILKTIM